MSPGDNVALPPGTPFGRYVIVRRVRRGGMGAVYEATHSELQKRVAIKALHPSVATDPVIRTRFLREGQLACRLRHPHVVDVWDVGIEGEIPYLVMEYLDGEDLGQLLRRNRVLPLEQLVEILLPVCAAVGTAHQEGVIHRDLKPANIFLARTRLSTTLPKVLDFGISKPVDGHDQTLTGTTAMLGTPYYMAPEQAKGSRFSSPMSDQYALGVILYECATGKRPFTGGTIFETIHAVVEGRFEPPRRLQPLLPEPFEAVILRAMSRLPTARFPTVEVLGRELLAFASPSVRAAWTPLFDPPPPLNPDTEPNGTRLPPEPPEENVQNAHPPIAIPAAGASSLHGTTPVPAAHSLHGATPMSIPSLRLPEPLDTLGRASREVPAGSLTPPAGPTWLRVTWILAALCVIAGAAAVMGVTLAMRQHAHERLATNATDARTGPSPVHGATATPTPGTATTTPTTLPAPVAPAALLAPPTTPAPALALQSPMPVQVIDAPPAPPAPSVATLAPSGVTPRPGRTRTPHEGHGHGGPRGGEARTTPAPPDIDLPATSPPRSWGAVTAPHATGGASQGSGDTHIDGHRTRARDGARHGHQRLAGAELTVRACLRASVLATVCVGVATLAGGPAWGQSGEVEALFRQGVELRREHHDAEALEVFRRVFYRVHSPRALAQVGLAEQAVGEWVEAGGHVALALQSTSDPWIVTNRAALEEARTRIEEHLGDLEVLANVPGAELRIGGRVIATLPLRRPVRVIAGTVTVEVAAPGYHAEQRTVTVRPGGLGRESVLLVREESVSAAGFPFHTVGWIAFGSAGFMLALGTVAVIVGAVAADTWNGPGCLSPVTTREQNCPGAQSTAISAGTLAVTGFALGAALGVTSAVLLLRRPSHPSPTARFGCGPGVGLLGLGCTGTF